MRRQRKLHYKPQRLKGLKLVKPTTPSSKIVKLSKVQVHKKASETAKTNVLGRMPPIIFIMM
jgi:hypothetical protein